MENQIILRAVPIQNRSGQEFSHDFEIEYLMEEREPHVSKVISSICFVPRGGFNPNPTFAKVSPEDILEYEKELGKGQKEEPDQTLESNEFVEQVNFEEEYMKTLKNQVMKNDSRFPVNNRMGDEEEEDDSDEEEYTLDSTDTMFFMNNNSDLVSTLDVWIHEKNGDTYLHHNSMISSQILCVDWMNYHPSQENKPRNLALIGTFLPEIEIWDLDVVDDIKPIVKFSGHKGGVMSIHWNKNHRNMFASGSEDNTAKVWDCKKNVCVSTVPFPEKVSRVRWNQTNTTLLLSTIFNNSCSVYDPRKKNERLFFKVKAPPEDAVWNPWNPQVFYCSLSSGEIMGYDVRKNGQCMFVFKAHKKECNALDFNNKVPNMLFSCGSDGYWKVWNCNTRKLFFQKKISEDNIYDIKSYENLVVIGGENINTTYNLEKQQQFQSIFKKKT